MPTIAVKHNLVTAEQYAYLAGLVDGDGSFCWNVNVGPRLNIAQINKPLIDKVLVVYGGSTHSMGLTANGKKPIWLWTGTANWLREHQDGLIPHLILKQPQALLFKELLTIRRMGAQYTDLERSRMKEIKLAVTEANSCLP